MQKVGNDLKRSGIFNPENLKKIDRQGKPCVFSERLKTNMVNYILRFLYYPEISNFCLANIYLYNCFVEYEIENWKMEMKNIKEVFHLDIKDPENEIDDTLSDSMEKNRIYPMKNFEGNYLKIDKAGINLISLAYYDLDMQIQLEKYDTSSENPLISGIQNNANNLENFNIMEIEKNDSSLGDSLDGIVCQDTKGPWKIIHSENSYVPGNILFLEDKSSLDFSFSFHHLIKDDYKFYLHQSMIDMRNANLTLQIIINDKLVFEMENFPSKEILEQSFNKGSNDELIDVYICDINKQMFDLARNNLKDIKFDLKSSVKSDKSADTNASTIKSTPSLKSINSFKSQNSFLSLNSSKGVDLSGWNLKDYTVRIRFTNNHLLWKAGWYLDGGKLVRSI
mgnify:FL=1